MRLMLLICLVVSVSASAQRAEPSRSSAPSRKNAPRVQELVIDDAELIDGATVGPDTIIFDNAKRPAHSRFIVVRESFRNEALASVAELP